MECTEFKLQIPMLMDGALGPAEEAELMAHMEKCQPCAMLLEHEQHYHHFVRKRLKPAAAPMELRRQVLRNMQKEHSRRWQVPAICSSVAAAAAVIALILTGGNFGGNQIPGTIKTAIARQSDERLPLDVQSANEAELRQFFASHLPFDLALPQMSGKMRVRGGRLTYLGEQPSAFISYDINGSKAALYIFTDRESAEYANKSQAPCQVIKEDDRQRQAVIWHRGNVVYSLVGDETLPQINEFVKGGCE